MRMLPLLALALMACEAPDGDDEASGEVEPEVMVIQELWFEEPGEDGTTGGFDLDGHVTTGAGYDGCGQPDDVGPDGEEGIDSAFAGLLPALEAAGGLAVHELVQAAVDSGELLIMMEMYDLASTQSDTCVDIGVLRGAGKPTLGADGRLVAGQTFDRDLEQPSSAIDCATVDDGYLRGDGLEMRLPLAVFDETIDLQVHDGVVGMEMHRDGTYSGYIAGGVDISNIQENVDGFDAIPSSINETMSLLLGQLADLRSPGQDTCDRISVTLGFEGVSAYFFDTPPAALDTGEGAQTADAP